MITVPRENDLEGAQDQGGKHGGQKGMPKPEPRPATRPDRVGGMLRMKASCAMSEGRSSRGTRSGLSKSAERIPSGDESGKPRVAIRHERREANRLAADWIVVAFAPSMAVGGTLQANPCGGDRPFPWRSQGWPRPASLPKPKQR